MNLLLSAAQALARGLRTDGRSRGAIVITTAEQGEFVVLQVEDDGPGISLEVAKELFEPFVTYGGRPGASGLGLLHFSSNRGELRGHHLDRASDRRRRAHARRAAGFTCGHV